MKPPVEAPTSRQSRPADVDPERVERVLELDPAARDEARRLVDDQLGVVGDQLAGLAARPGRRAPMRTRPARTDSAAPCATGASPRSASRVSARRRRHGWNGTGPARTREGLSTILCDRVTHKAHIRSYLVVQ